MATQMETESAAEDAARKLGCDILKLEQEEQLWPSWLAGA